MLGRDGIASPQDAEFSMTRQSRLVRWGTTAITCALLGGALAAPEHLPIPLQRTLNAAVTQAAHFWLWVLNQPGDSGDNPSARWDASPVRLDSPAAQPEPEASEA